MLRRKLSRAASSGIQFIGGASTGNSSMEVPAGTSDGDLILLFKDSAGGTPTGFQALSSTIFYRFYTDGTTRTINNLYSSADYAEASIALTFRGVHPGAPFIDGGLKSAVGGTPPAVNFSDEVGAIVTFIVKSASSTSSSTGYSASSSYTKIPEDHIEGPTYGSQASRRESSGETSTTYYSSQRKASSFKIINNYGLEQPTTYLPATASVYSIGLRRR